jgi:hypothetical protein
LKASTSIRALQVGRRDFMVGFRTEWLGRV